MQRRDPFDILRQHDPADTARIVPDEDLLAAITSTRPNVRRRTSVRRRALLIAAVILALASIAAAWYLTTRPVLTLAVTCYAELSLEGDRHGTVAGSGTSSVDDCRYPWEAEILTNPHVEPGSVPDLTACVNEMNGLAVFPTADEDICEQLGLTYRSPDRPSDRLDTVSRLQKEITEFILLSRCQLLDDTEAEVTEILARLGLDDWTVIRRAGNPGEPCGSIAYNVPDRTVIIVPIDPPPPGG